MQLPLGPGWLGPVDQGLLHVHRLRCACICCVCPQAGQTASQIGAPKTAAKGKKAAPGAMLSDEAQQAMALVEVAAAELPELEESRLVAQAAAAHVPSCNLSSSADSVCCWAVAQTAWHATGCTMHDPAL